MQLVPSENIIELQNVSFAFSKEEVIKDVSLVITRGDYVGIIGPNGGGKSTLLKLMLGLLKPQKGTIELFKTNINEFQNWHKIGYVSQKTSFEINFPVTVEEVVSMGRFAKTGLFRAPTPEDKKKIYQALEQVGMLDLKSRQIGDLSGGQQQRVFIARALSSQPEIVVLDEPTAGVDIKTQEQFYKLLRTLNKELNLTMVLVSHELDIVAHESTKLGFINKTLDYYGDPITFLKGDYFHGILGREGLEH